MPDSAPAPLSPFRRLFSSLVVLTLLAAGLSPAAAAKTTPPTTPASPASVAASTATATSSSSTAGAVYSVRNAPVWGGKNGKIAKKGRQFQVPTKAKRIPSSVRTVLLQVEVFNAKSAGTLELRAAGTKRGKVPSVAFSKGNSSTTVLVDRNGKGRVAVRSSAKTRLRISVVGYVAGSPRTPGPGGTKAIAAHRLIDSSKKVGAAQLRKGKSASVSVLGLGGVPTSGVRAVWLQVQANGRGKGAISVRRADGGASRAAAARYGKGWSTSLVLAPVDAQGRVTYSLRGKNLRDLRVAMVGWVAETAETSSTGTLNGGVVPVAATNRKAKKAKSNKKVVRWSVKVAGKGVPTRAGRVLLRLHGKTGKNAGTIRVGTSLGAVGKAKAVDVPVFKRSDAAVTIVAPVSNKGKVFIGAPKGTKIQSVVVLGYKAGTVGKKLDKSRPEVKITSPAANAQISLAKTPVVTITGTVRDDQSGIRRVAVYGGSTLLGTATVDTTVVPGRWSIETSMPGGNHNLRVRASNAAGLESSATRAVSVRLPSSTETVVLPETRVVSDGEAAGILSATDSILTVKETYLEPIVGQVLVLPPTEATPDGALREVVSITREDSKIVVNTADATLTQVFAQTSYTGYARMPQQSKSHTRVVRGAPPSLSLEIGSNATIPFSRLVIPQTAFSIGYGSSFTFRGSFTNSLYMELRISAKFRFLKKPDVNLEYFELSKKEDSEVEWSATSSRAAAVSFSKELFRLPIIKGAMFAVGPVPVHVSSTFAITLDLEGEFEREGTVGVKATETKRNGAGFSNGSWGPIHTPPVRNVVQTGSEVVTGSLGVALNATADFKLYGFAGPYIGAALHFTFSHEDDPTAQQKTIKLTYGVDILIGAEVSLELKLGWKVSFNITLARWETAIPLVSIVLFTRTVPYDSTDPAPTDPEDPTDPDPSDPDPSDPDPDDPGPDPEPEPEPAPEGLVYYTGFGGKLQPDMLPGLSPVVKAAVGAFVPTWAVLREDGSVWWRGDYSTGPIRVGGEESVFIDLAVTQGGGIGLRHDGELVAFGSNASGLIPGVELGSLSSEGQFLGLSGVVDIGASDFAACAVLGDGRAVRMGTGFLAGYGGSTSWSAIAPDYDVFAGSEDFVGVSDDCKHFMGVSGTAYSAWWNGPFSPPGVPMSAVPELHGMRNVVSAPNNAEVVVATMDDSTVISYDPVESVWPNLVYRTTHFEPTIRDIGAGYRTNYAVDGIGDVWSWGDDACYFGYGALGQGPIQWGDLIDPNPVKILQGKDVMRVQGGLCSTLALTSNGDVYGWGSNWSGELGPTHGNPPNYPVHLTDITNATAVASTYRTLNGEYEAWSFIFTSNRFGK